MPRNSSWAMIGQKWKVVALVLVFLGTLLSGTILENTRTEAQGSASNLQGLRVVGILVEELGRGAEEEQITRRVLEDQVLVTLRSKLPGLTIDSTARPYLYVNLSLLSSTAGHAGFLSLEVKRPVDVLIGADRIGSVPSRRFSTTATVWDRGVIFRGPRGGAAQQVREILEGLMEGFLADYFRANP